MEVRELLLLTPPHQNHSPNQPPNRSQSQGTLTSATPIEVFCHLLYALDLIPPNSTWVMVCTQQPHFSTALSIQSMFPVNIAVAWLSEEKSVPESFVTNLTAVVSNCDTVAPIEWERVCKPKAPGLRKRRSSDNGVCSDCCVVCFPSYTSECPSALFLQILLTF